MIAFEDIKIYLPKYLSPHAEAELFSELRSFPDNLDSRFYTFALQEQLAIFQGDGIRNLLVVNLPDHKIAPASCLVMSNTCDIALENRRLFHSSLCYAPIFSLSKYESMVVERQLKTEEARAQHLSAIRSQKVTQIFYLPKGGTLESEGIVFLDRICHAANESVDRSSLPQSRLFSLSNYGAYLFLLKLSIHFTRLNDQVDRTVAA